MRAALTETEVALSQENTDLRRQLEEAKASATMYKAMVCSQSCKMHYPPPEGEPLPWADLQAEVERLRGAARELLNYEEHGGQLCKDTILRLANKLRAALDEKG